MAITNAVGLEHLPQGYSVGTGETGYGLSNSELQINSFWGDASNLACLRLLNNKIVLGKKQNINAQCAGKNTIKMSSFVGTLTTTLKKVIFGFRVNRLIAPSAQCLLFGVAGDVNSAGDGYQPLIYHNVGDANGTSIYYEVEIDFIANTVLVAIDGVAGTAVALSSSITKTSFKDQYWQIGTINTYYMTLTGENVLFSMSDIYCIVDSGIAGDTQITRLGPIAVKRLPVLSTTGAGYTPTAGKTIVQALSAARADSTVMTTPVVATPVDRTPLRVKFDTAGIAGFSVKGVVGKLSAFKDSGAADNLSVKFSAGGVDSTPQAVTVGTTTPVKDVSMGSLSKLPDTTALSPAALANLEVVVTPTA